MKAGNYCNTIGETLEGKRQPQGFGINRFLPRNQVKRLPSNLGAGYKGLSFAPSGGSINILSDIPYSQIIAIGGTVYTVYRCTKFVIKGYHWTYKYIKNKCTPKYNSKYLVLFISEYLVTSLNKSLKMDRVYRIYYMALRL